MNQKKVSGHWAGLVALLLLLMACAMPVPVAMADADAAWDVRTPRGKTRDIQFSTDEGTWMSVDVSPDGKWIIFDLLGEIYRLPIGGGEAQLLTRDSGIAVNYQPKYSPDGRTVVFVSDRSGQDNLWLMNADGGNIRPLLLDENTRFAEPDWTPDGSAVVATRRFKRPGMGFIVTTDMIWLVPLDGSAPRELLGTGGKPDIAEQRAGSYRSDMIWNGADRFQWPAVSPDGRYVYFHRSWYGGNPRHLERIDLRTGLIQSVTETKDRYTSDCCAPRPSPTYLGEIAPEPSPDGKWLAFARRIPEGRSREGGHEMTGRTALWLRDLSTGEERVVMDPVTRDTANSLPNWSARVLPAYAWTPDSKSIVITEGGKLRRVTIADGKVATIPFRAHVHRTISGMARNQVSIEDAIFTPRFVRWPNTSPDGSRLVFEAAGTLWIKTLPTGEPQALAPEANEVQLTPSWSSDGRSIVFTTAVDGRAGHIWVVDTKTRERRRVTAAPGIYMRPSFGAGNKWIYFDRWPAALTRTADANEWELHRVPVRGGQMEFIARSGVPTFADPAYRDMRHTLVQGEEDSKLEGIKLPTGERFTLAAAAAGADELHISPDGQWLAVRQAQDVYVVPANSPGAPVDVLSATAGSQVQRVTQTGGGYAHWRKDGTLELASAGDYVTYDPKKRVAQSHELGLRLPRAIGKGVVALTGGRVITMKDQQVIERGTVLVRDGRIACVGECDVPAGAKVLDVSGKTLMPGMFDVHAHSFREDGNDEIISLKRAASAAYLAYGVTTIHDPDSAPLPAFTIHDMVEAGRIVGPRTYSTGFSMTCIEEARHLRPIRTLDDALEHVDRKKHFGVLSMKDYLQCTRTQRQMLAEAARLRGMSMTTEMGPPEYMLSQTMNGHTGWEHSLQFALYNDYVQFFGQAGATYSPQSLLSGFSHNMALEYWFSHEPLLEDPKARLWTPWQRSISRRLFIKKPIAEYMYPVVARDAGRIKAAGGHVAVGAHGEADGVGTHWEVWTLASGMPNQAALEAATIDSARFLGLEGELGSLEPGKIADLLVLDANPLENIRNTATLQWTMKAGVIYSADTLDEIWPVRRSYGELPWVNEEILRDDVRGSGR